MPCPNFIWHVDGNHKLIKWKLVVHGAMDGYSRMLMFLQCSNNNRALTVMQLFSTAITQFGRPLHVRTDHGGENVLIWEDMWESRCGDSILTGSSVHNQRIERFNPDLNTNCSYVCAPIFYELESMNVLNLDNETYIFCLHYVYIPRINRTLAEFKDAFNMTFNVLRGKPNSSAALCIGQPSPVPSQPRQCIRRDYSPFSTCSCAWS